MRANLITASGEPEKSKRRGGGGGGGGGCLTSERPRPHPRPCPTTLAAPGLHSTYQPWVLLMSDSGSGYHGCDGLDQVSLLT